jgi:transglutaminase superfamily protein
MKWIGCLLFAAVSFPVLGQEMGIPVNLFIDQSVRDYKKSTPALLVSELTSAAQTDKQKVSLIFRWITENISYNIKAGGRNRNIYVYEQPDDDDTGRIIKPLNLRVAETVLKRRMAICDGYARLFKAMCDNAAIPCEIITGYARTGWGNRRTGFSSNHTWNAVYFDSAWHLLDATWASGFTNFAGDLFTQHYDEKYFLTPPEQFVQDHYPEDVRWTLLKEPPVLHEFDLSPLRYIGYIKMGIHSYTPDKGVIEASVGDSIYFEAYASVNQGLLEVVSGNRPVDTIWNDNEPVPVIGKKKACFYKITGNTGDWLYVVCNGFVILRYKINIRKPENKMASLQTGAGPN